MHVGPVATGPFHGLWLSSFNGTLKDACLCMQVGGTELFHLPSRILYSLDIVAEDAKSAERLQAGM